MKDIKLIQGDCLVEMPKLIEQGIKVDMVLTDPPYGTTACKWDNVIPFEPMWDCLKGLINKNSAIALFGSEPFSSMLRCSNLKMFKYDWVWDKKLAGNGVLAKIQPLKIHEICSIFSICKTIYNPIKTKGTLRKKMFNGVLNTDILNTLSECKEYSNDEYYPKSIIEFSLADRRNRMHPTQKPVALLEYLIKTYTNEGDTVLDFTMGSGSTGVACVNLNRKFIGIELDDGYFNIAQDRIQKAINEKQSKLF